jgi:hypothetical protein
MFCKIGIFQRETEGNGRRKAQKSRGVKEGRKKGRKGRAELELEDERIEVKGRIGGAVFSNC